VHETFYTEFFLKRIVAGETDPSPIKADIPHNVDGFEAALFRNIGLLDVRKDRMQQSRKDKVKE
jgi:hypothetical protein